MCKKSVSLFNMHDCHQNKKYATRYKYIKYTIVYTGIAYTYDQT